MSNNKRYIITINEPCNEAWDEMTPSGCGRFCKSCNKVVHDLTNFTQEALQKWASEQKEPVCGRLVADQYNKPLAEKAPSKKRDFIKIAASLLAMSSLSSVMSVNAQKAPGRNFKMEQVPSPKQRLSIDDSLKFQVRGFISDSVSEKPLAGARILIDHKVMAVTDVNGQYSFILPKEYRKAIVEVTAEKMKSHQQVTDIIRLRKLPVELNFVLKEYERRETVVMSAGIVAIVVVDDKRTAPKKRTWYQKILGKPGD